MHPNESGENYPYNNEPDYVPPTCIAPVAPGVLCGKPAVYDDTYWRAGWVCQEHMPQYTPSIRMVELEREAAIREPERQIPLQHRAFLELCRLDAQQLAAGGAVELAYVALLQGFHSARTTQFEPCGWILMEEWRKAIRGLAADHPIEEL